MVQQRRSLPEPDSVGISSTTSVHHHAWTRAFKVVEPLFCGR